MPTVQEYNTKFQEDNPQYFITPAYGQTTTDPTQMAKNRANLIAGSGGTLKEVNGNVVPMLSSDNGKKTIDKAIEEHKLDIVSKTPTKDVTTTPEKTSTKKNPAMEAIGAITPDEANATGVKIADYSYDTNTGYLIPKSSTGENDVNAQYNIDEKEVKDTFAPFIASLDASTQNLIKTYQDTFTERIAEEKKATENAVRSANTTNLRTGISRYAPNQAREILTFVERQGLDRIRKIGIEEAGLIAKAEESLQDKKSDSYPET